VGYESEVTFQNSIILFEPDYDYYRGIESGERRFVNSIILGTPDLSFNYLQSTEYLNTVVEYTTVEGGHPGNMSFIPDFDQTDVPYQLVENSPGIDAGHPDPQYFDAEGSAYKGSRINDLGLYGGPFARRSNLVLAVEKDGLQPMTLSNYPNPVNDHTTITYSLEDSQEVSLSLLSANGVQQTLLLDEFKPSGNHEMAFYAGDLPAGVYLLQLTTSESRIVHRLMIQ
jgi:hypothetical protein